MNRFFGLLQATPSIVEQKSIVLVEGFMDCIAFAQAGITNVVSCFGTTLSYTQLQLLRRMVPHAHVMFDSDEAGIKASKAIVKMLQAEGIKVTEHRPPKGLDPSDLIVKIGDDVFKKKFEAGNWVVNP